MGGDPRSARAAPRLARVEQPVLRAEGLVLSPPVVDDAAAWADVQDEVCARWFGWPGRPTVERCRDCRGSLVDEQEEDSFTWAIRDGEALVGGIDLKLDDGAWNVSYFVHPERRGEHVARRALRAVVALAFTGLGLDAVSTRVHVENVASRRVLGASGFVPVETVRSAWGDHDDVVYECVRGPVTSR